MMITSTGTPFSVNFLGYEFQQNAVALSAFDQLSKAVEPARFLEIGTATGGLSVFLALIAPVVTCDITDYRQYRPIMNKLGIDFRIGDVFQHIDDLVEIIRLPGTTVVLCDGGNKPLEFRTFAPFLKEGDIIMAHDYSSDPAIWGFSEIRDEDVQDLDYLDPFMQDTFIQAAWLCRQRHIYTLW